MQPAEPEPRSAEKKEKKQFEGRRERMAKGPEGPVRGSALPARPGSAEEKPPGVLWQWECAPRAEAVCRWCPSQGFGLGRGRPMLVYPPLSALRITAAPFTPGGGGGIVPNPPS